MKIKNISISNFRGLKSISFKLPTNISVIVGPNAIGKSTILESIRLVKAVLAPTFREETVQTLTSLGAYIPQLNLLKLDAISGNKSLPTNISIKIELTQKETENIRNSLSRLAEMM